MAIRGREGRAFTRMLVVAAVLIGIVGVVPAHADEHDAPTVEVIASGLDSPRGLDVAPNGAVYVAEAGRGGDGPCVPGAGPGTEVCFGLSGAITKIARGRQARIIEGLPSLANADGIDASGPEDVIWSKGFRLYAPIGAAVTEAERESLGDGAELLGHFVSLRRLNRPGFPDLVTYEGANNPDGGVIDSNPKSALRDGANDFVIADAGANALLHFDRVSREVSTLATFPGRDIGGGFPSDAVPTSVTRGPDGAYYVGQLTGFPFAPGAARVYRVVPGEEPTIYAEGLTTILDLEFDSKGNLWVIQFAQNLLMEGPFGALVRIAPDGTQTTVTALSEDLFAPTGLAVGPDDSIYISNCGDCAGRGEVLKVTMP